MNKINSIPAEVAGIYKKYKNTFVGEQKMSMKNKIQNAKETDWIAEGIPGWKVKLIVILGRIKAKLFRVLK